jgi:hypothetical protein
MQSNSTKPNIVTRLTSLWSTRNYSFSYFLASKLLYNTREATTCFSSFMVQHDTHTQNSLMHAGSNARPRHIILRSDINQRFFVVAALLIKPKQHHGKKPKQKHWFVYKFYGFLCSAYQNKQKQNRHFFSYTWALIE